MKVAQLEVSNFRNITNTNIELSHHLNIFYGQNGSGKTSLLEVLHFLGLGRSFRTRNPRRLIQHDRDSFILTGELSQPGVGKLSVGVERKPQQLTLKVAGKPTTSLAELAELLPLQLLNADSHLLLTSGPLVRRQFLDWGLFHVEHQFLNYWRRTNRIIKQRNANLKYAKSYEDLCSWDEELIACATWLNNQRLNYIKQLTPMFSDVLETLLDKNEVLLHYSSGWNKEHSLETMLQETFSKDQQFGYTHCGPHRADLQLQLNRAAASETLSQGQQKLAVYALRLAQAKLLRLLTGKNCIFLIDDLPSELDEKKRGLVSELLINLDSQVFVTCIDPQALPNLLAHEGSRVFHVEHGKIHLSPSSAENDKR